MTLFLMALALAAGSLLTLQVGANAQLARFTGHPAYATIFSFVTGLVALFACSLAVPVPWPSMGSLFQAPWWAWIGGILGACYLWIALMLAPRLGAAVLVSLVVAGQLLASLLLDHYGLLGFPQHPASLPRTLGVVFLFLGVVLIRWF
jgi:bacterial/archaeal transporter family-2 protein